MAGRIEAKLKELGLTLPEAAAPVANYVPSVRSGNLLVVSGQLPLSGGKIVALGKLGANVSVEEGQNAAKASALNIIAQAKAALGGDLDRVVRVVRLGGFISCTPDFTKQALVMNGASDLMVSVFGDAGRHARTTIGVPVLPLDAAVEVEALIEVA